VQFTANGTGGSQTLFFNKAAYTAGSVNVNSIQSAFRSTASVDTSGLVSRVPTRFSSLPGVDPSTVYVHYSASALRSSGRSAQSIASSVGARGTMQIAANGDDLLNAVPVPAGQSLDAFTNTMRSQAGVTNVEPAHLRYHETATAVNPNDCHFVQTSICSTSNLNQQWDMLQIGAPNAWAYFGSTASAAFASKTSKIAIIDTGFDCNAPTNANDLAPNVAFSESIVGGTANANGSPAASGCAALDTDGHGSNVAGIADAVTNNGFGFAGVGANAQLYIYRIFPAGQGTSASTVDEALAINDAVSKHVNVINLSLGSPSSFGPDAGEQQAVLAAINAGTAVVAASGNDGASSVDYPGAYNGVISVGATSLADGQLNGRGNSNGSASAPTEYIASYSNYGPNLTLVAPGGDPGNNGNDNDNLHWITNLYSTGNTQQACKGGNPGGPPDGVCAARFAGTSQATPHVTGAVALMFAKNPSLSPAQVQTVLQGTSDDICSLSSFACPSGTVMEGKGRLDIYRAMASVSGDTSPPAYKPAPAQFLVFAYSGSFVVGSGPPVINVVFTHGIPLSASGTFQMGDIPANVSSYKIGVWYNAAGNGVLTANDSFGSVSCSGQTACAAASNIVISRVSAGQSF
jgi:subtilisin family serine protease